MPLSNGVLSLVVAPFGTGTAVPLLSLFTTSVAGAGTTLSTVKSIAGDAVLTLPAASTTVVLRLCAPSSSVGEVKLHWPLLPTEALPMMVVPSRIITVLPASAVPVRNGVLSLVKPPLVIATGDVPSSLLATTFSAAAGGVASITTPMVLGALTFPAASLAVTLKVWVPSASALAGVKVQVPPAPTVVDPNTPF